MSRQAFRGLIAAVRGGLLVRVQLGAPQFGLRPRERNGSGEGKKKKKNLRKSSPAIGWGRGKLTAAQSQPDRGREQRAPCRASELRGTGFCPRPPRRRSPRAPRGSAFKARSPNVRCPLLIGCDAATNQRLPLGLPGAQGKRLRVNKGSGPRPEGRDLTTPGARLEAEQWVGRSFERCCGAWQEEHVYLEQPGGGVLFYQQLRRLETHANPLMGKRENGAPISVLCFWAAWFLFFCLTR